MAFRRYHMYTLLIVMSQVLALFFLIKGYGDSVEEPSVPMKLISSHRAHGGKRRRFPPPLDNVDVLDKDIERQPHHMELGADPFAQRAIGNPVPIGNDLYRPNLGQHFPRELSPDDTFAQRDIGNRAPFGNNLDRHNFGQYPHQQLRPDAFAKRALADRQYLRAPQGNDGNPGQPRDIAGANRRFYRAQPGKAVVYNNVPPITSPKLIVIMTQWRFGSSVVGELFNQNSDVLYLFEPLWTLRKLQLRSRQQPGELHASREEVSRGVLGRFAHCKFRADFVEVYNTWHPGQNKQLCRVDPECALYDDPWFENFCRNYRGRLVTKVIRTDLEILRSLVEKDKIDLKIIHLVRDPRAAAASRIDYISRGYPEAMATARQLRQDQGVGRLKPLGLLDNIPDYVGHIQEMQDNNPTVRGMCKWIRENTKVSPNGMPPWLRGRYHFVKFEDFAMEPLKASKEIYRFVGLPMPQNVETWITKNTNAFYNDREAKMGTRKNSLESATHWINDLSELEIGQIENECSDVLDLLGYKPFREVKQKSLTNGRSRIYEPKDQSETWADVFEYRNQV